MKRSLTAAAFACATTLAGCVDLEDPRAADPHAHDPVESQHASLYVLESSRWADPVIPVCWENPRADHDDERRWVREAAEQTWAAHSLVEFVGWGDCTADSRGIRIRVEEDGPHVKALGRHLDGRRDGMVLNFEFETWSTSCQNDRRYCIQNVAVHEFGHALGFAHEHNRDDTPDSCDDAPQGTDGDVTIGPWDLDSVMNYCNPNWGGHGRLSATDIAGVQAVYGTALWNDDFGADDGWDPDRHLRLMGDVNGDGTDDIVGFAEDGVYVGRAVGGRFSTPVRWIRDFAIGAGGWRLDWHPRMLGDVNGDGRQDIIGFGSDEVLVSLSTGSGFTSARGWLSDMTYNRGWRVERHVRTVADVNGDGRDDIVAFGNSGVYVALSQGDSFGPVRRVIGNMGYDQGWRVDRHPRLLGDVNGDGRADIVGIGGAGMYLARGRADGTFENQGRVNSDMGYNDGWRMDRNPRMLADVDGDGRDDVVGFGDDGVYVSRSAGYDLLDAVRRVNDFGTHAGGWDPARHVRLVGDVDGDGRADIVAFGTSMTFLARGRIDGRFEATEDWILGLTIGTGGWQVERNPRVLADVDGDGALDVVGFANPGTAVFVY